MTLIMRKKFFIKKKGQTTINKSKGETFEELDLFVINSESLYIVFDLVPNLSFNECYSLYISYFKKEKLTKYIDNTLANSPEIFKCRENALKKICQGILRNEIHIIFKKGYSKDKYMKHSQFREYIDDYLADELSVGDKAAFEHHMLACDFCGFLFLINRDIVEILNKCGEELFGEMKDKDNRDSTKFILQNTEQACGDISHESSSRDMGGILKAFREKINKFPKQFSIALILLQEESPQLLQTLSGFFRNGAFSASIMRVLRTIQTFLRFLIP